MSFEMVHEYAAAGLAAIPVRLGTTNDPLIPWKQFQWDGPSTVELEAMFRQCGDCNVGLICGAPSNNLVVVDAETKAAFHNILDTSEKAQIDTWVVETARGGHVYLRTPVPVQPRKQGDFEVRGQGQYVLAPPSIHPSGAQYRFLNKPPDIWQLPSLNALPWLPLSPTRWRRMPRSAMALLHGRGIDSYDSRSQAEQAIMTILVNEGFGFDEILGLFQALPAAGKFAQISRKDAPNAVRWLRVSFDKARAFCEQESPTRQNARLLLAWAADTTWPGRTGSSDKAVFLAHAQLAYHAGHIPYHGSCRDLAEIAGCQKFTASWATRRLLKAGLIRLERPGNSLFASQYSLTPFPPEGANLDTFPHQQHVRECINESSFLIPDAFRQTGLGRSAFEVWSALQGKEMTAQELAAKTGRHNKTVRSALRRMEEVVDWGSGEVLSLVERDGKRWKALPNVDLGAVARALGTDGAREKQRIRHREERLCNRIKLETLNDAAISRGGPSSTLETLRLQSGGHHPVTELAPKEHGKA